MAGKIENTVYSGICFARKANAYIETLTVPSMHLCFRNYFQARALVDIWTLIIQVLSPVHLEEISEKFLAVVNQETDHPPTGNLAFENCTNTANGASMAEKTDSAGDTVEKVSVAHRGRNGDNGGVDVPTHMKRSVLRGLCGVSLRLRSAAQVERYRAMFFCVYYLCALL